MRSQLALGVDGAFEFAIKFFDQFQIPFDGVFLQHEKVETIRVFKRLLGQVGLRHGQRPREVADRLPLSSEEIAFDLHREDRPAPTMLEYLGGIPQPLGRILHLLHKDDVAPPGNPGDGWRRLGVGQFRHSLCRNL